MYAKTFFIVLLLATASFGALAEDATPVEEAKPAEVATPKGEKFEFQAEVSRLMDIIINSLYTNREIFLRELVSNAADAIDKVRFQSLTDKSIMGENDTLEIKIRADKDKKTLTITDTGCGMTKDELIKNLGIVARSGTTEFVEAAAKGTDSLSLIGQFGVGFYSVYLVAERVVVTSKSNNDDQYIWESTADATFTITKDENGNTLGRGTQITLHLKEDAEEYLNDTKLKELVGKYSQFISFPISVHNLKSEEKEVEDVEATETARQKWNEDKEAFEKEQAEKAANQKEGDEEEPPKHFDEFKPVMKKQTDLLDNWEVVNNSKAIWTRAPSEITETEYEEFYKSLTKDHLTALEKMHFVAEGEITFKAIIYIPKEAEAGLYDKFYEKNSSLKLYVRRVMITDDFKDFVPKYLNFVKGVVDSDDLPLNVNRETLAQSRVLKVMSKKITRKVLELLRKMASDSKKAEEELEEYNKKTDDEKKESPLENESKLREQKDMFSTFWAQFGRSVKLGILDDRANRNKLVKLLRFQTSKSNGKLIGLEEYVDRMKDKQKHIYFLAGENLDSVRKSPFLEKAVKKDYEVIFFDDPLDEYVIQIVPEYDGTSMQSLAKDGLTLGDAKKNLQKKQEEEFKPLTNYIKDNFSNVEKVQVSSRLAQSPMVLVTGTYGWTANMERIMKAQTMHNAKDMQQNQAKRTLEINPYHPMIQALNKADLSEQKNKDLVTLMYDAAYIQSGFSYEQPDEFAKRIHRVIANGLSIDPNTPVDEEPEEDLEDENKKEEPASDDSEKVEAEDDKKEETKSEDNKDEL